MSGISSVGFNPSLFFSSNINAEQRQVQPEEKGLVDKIQEVGGFREFAEAQQEKARFLRALDHAFADLNLPNVLQGVDVDSLSVDEIKQELRSRLSSEDYAQLLEKIEEYIKQELDEDIREGRRDYGRGDTFSELV